MKFLIIYFITFQIIYNICIKFIRSVWEEYKVVKKEENFMAVGKNIKKR